MNALRKPKRQELSQLFLELDPAAPPDPAIGQIFWDWYASVQLPPWTPEEARQHLKSYPQIIDDLDSFFLHSLTVLAESGLGWPADSRPNDVGLAVMATHLAAYVRATKQNRPKMEKVHVHEGVKYRPLAAAARLANAPRQTVNNWVKNKTEFAGQPLQTLYIAALDRYLISEESIDRMANRFVQWPSGEPTGTVTIGSTKDRSGYLGTTEAAHILGVSNQTAWVWAKDGTVPTGRRLDVVKCTASTERERYYIRERDVYDLKKQLPKTGLKRGRRPQQPPRSTGPSI